MQEPILRFEKVSKKFCGARLQVTALSEISFDLAEGEFLGVIGPSGGGKTTLLRMAAGLEMPTAGKITFRGETVKRPDRSRGLVFQAYNAFPWLDVRENIGFGLDGLDPRIKKAKVDRWLDFTDLTAFSTQLPKELSGGMQQRLALARSMVVEPDLLLMDEPFGALDERTRKSMQVLLMDAVKQLGCSVVLVTHDIREAIFLSGRVLLLSAHPGRVVGIFSGLNADSSRRHEIDAAYETILSQFPI